MPIVANDLRPTIRYLIHLGLVEIRNLAYAGGHDARIAKLADVLEFLPELLGVNRTPDFVMIREQFEQYQSEYRPVYDYLAYLNGKTEVPEYWTASVSLPAPAREA